DLTLDMLSPLLQPTSPIRLATEPSAVSRPCVADGVQGKGVDFPASCSLPTKAALPQEPSRRRRKSPLPAASASPDQRVTRGPSKVPSLPATSSVHELASSAPRATSFPRPAEVLDLTVSDDELVSSYSSMPPRSVQPQIHHQPTHATRGLSVRCGQRRYRMLERFMEDVWLLSDTAKHMFPVDKALHDQAAAFVSALSNVLRELKVPLRALQGQLT
ncbi:hypothetical protein DYB26_008759, partial [Aphanomyces astaci]